MKNWVGLLIVFGSSINAVNTTWCSKCGNSCAHGLFSGSTCAVLNQNAIITSRSGKNFLYMRPNGILTLYEKSTGITLWYGNVDNYGSSYLAMQEDGNLCTYNNFGPTWNTNTWKSNVKSQFCMVVQDSGPIVLYNNECTETWKSETKTDQPKFVNAAAFSSLLVADTAPIAVDDVAKYIQTLVPMTETPSTTTGTIIGIVGGVFAVSIVIIFIIIFKRKQRKESKSLPTLTQTSDTSSASQILPQYQNPLYPTSSNDSQVKKLPKYDKVVDDDKVLDMRPLRKYRLDQADITLLDSTPIASGANGEVWLGKLGSMEVAIKRMKKQSSTTKIQKIDCPYTVRFIGASWYSPEDLSCIVEYMNYGDLRTFLANTTPKEFTWPQKQLSIQAVVKGLLYLHNCATTIIHRDLKSRNVLLDSTKGTKLTDFGESREMNDETMTNDVGTFAWMAPEVISGRKYNASADIYSFGVLLSEYASHQVPYSNMIDPVTRQQVNQFQLISQITKGQLKPTIDAPNTPEWVIEIANKCLKFDPDDRLSILAIDAMIMKLPK
ncbi:kinase [Thraustotheca clavata]|uniref:Kinase n=1 Tax=Thraustotheca clavata TaxID=74557 RepID=A0A1V9ZYL5_9STRA|nr:kinase [Thraustotheca clavata]